MKRLLSLIGVAWFLAALHAVDVPQVTVLPPPQMDGGMPLMQALHGRQSTRAFSTESLALQVISNLLWAANGVNRTDSGKRTAPSASNRQELDIYVALPGGLFLYDAGAHRLAPVVSEDLRAATGTQDFVADAPVNLVYVADFARMGKISEQAKNVYSAANTGFVSQNVYLFCASEGLATVVRAGINRAALATYMRLRPEQKIILAQTVGYPRN